MTKRNYPRIGFTLNPQLIAELESLASERGISRSEAARLGLSFAIPLLRMGRSFNFDRALTILEHTQLALSYIMENHSKEDADELIDLALVNVREHHG